MFLLTNEQVNDLITTLRDKLDMVTWLMTFIQEIRAVLTTATKFMNVKKQNHERLVSGVWITKKTAF